jgi:N-acetylglucosaminyldiphosphoundecaprenol N-acetyl-beta-D-mannosaminyltransferase
MTRDRATLLGCEIDRLDMHQTLARCEDLIDSRQFAQHMSINVAKLVALRDDPALSEIVRGCELVNADGQGVVWASRLVGDPVPSRVAGVDLMLNLIARAEEKRYRIFILGATTEVLDRAVRNLRERHPGLQIAGYRDGYYRDDQVGDVAKEIRAARADVLFLAMSSPRKEYFLGEFGPDLGVSLVMGVGGSIDIVAGVKRRAPRVVQSVGLEWLFRLLQEPRRLASRYLRTNLRFVGLFLSEFARRRMRN